MCRPYLLDLARAGVKGWGALRTCLGNISRATSMWWTREPGWRWSVRVA